MDILDAGVFVSKWEARVPRHAKMTLWGPLQAKEMGFEGWEVQDGGETGFVLHNAGVALTMGRATSTLIFVRRLEKAFLTIYFGGYPTDAPSEQRKLDMRKVVSSCELFLARLAKEPVSFASKGELTLVDNGTNISNSTSGSEGIGAGGDGRQIAGGRRLKGGGGRIDVVGEPKRSQTWEV